MAASSEAPGNILLNVPLWEWGMLFGIVLTCIMADMLAHRINRLKNLSPGVMVGVFVAIGAAYGLFILMRHGGEAASLYYAAWVIEYSLSIDNVFIWIVILDTFKVPGQYRHKLLFLGVFGALVFRFIFIGLGAILLGKFAAYVIPIMVIVVAYSAYVVWKDDTEPEIENSLVYRICARIMPIAPGRNHGGRLTVRLVKPGHTKPSFMFTYLALAVAVIEGVDIGFAFDSVPAALGITSNAYLVFSSNAMAILGLRALFFVIALLKAKMSWLNEALAVILAFVAFKLALTWEVTFGGFSVFGFEVPVLFTKGSHHLPIWLSLGFIGLCLTVGVVASIKRPKQEKHAGPVAERPVEPTRHRSS
ncbi:hypothetical protein JNJ66_05440 [Candidatus Saccharibacteria bacterium]|nr:hypothetical protein [Candidatus Saccharibacteria bacterium]